MFNRSYITPKYQGSQKLLTSLNFYLVNFLDVTLIWFSLVTESVITRLFPNRICDPFIPLNYKLYQQILFDVYIIIL